MKEETRYVVQQMADDLLMHITQRCLILLQMPCVVAGAAAPATEQPGAPLVHGRYYFL